jgi:hypothetical protein
MNNINISLEAEIKNSEHSEAIKEEALKILSEITNGNSSDDKIKNAIQDDIYELIAKGKVNEGEQE